MNPHEIYDAVMVKSLEHNIDINFLYPAVLRLGENPNNNDDELFRAYLDWETGRLAGGIETVKPASEGETRIVNRDLSFIKGLKFYLPPGTRITNLHIDIYEKLLWSAGDMKTRFCLQVGSNEINKIVLFLCHDIIQNLYNRRVILN